MTWLIRGESGRAQHRSSINVPIFPKGGNIYFDSIFGLLWQLKVSAGGCRSGAGRRRPPSIALHLSLSLFPLPLSPPDPISSWFPPFTSAAAHRRSDAERLRPGSRPVERTALVQIKPMVTTLNLLVCEMNICGSRTSTSIQSDEQE